MTNADYTTGSATITTRGKKGLRGDNDVSWGNITFNHWCACSNCSKWWRSEKDHSSASHSAAFITRTIVDRAVHRLHYYFEWFCWLFRFQVPINRIYSNTGFRLKWFGRFNFRESSPINKFWDGAFWIVGGRTILYLIVWFASSSFNR